MEFFVNRQGVARGRSKSPALARAKALKPRCLPPGAKESNFKINVKKVFRNAASCSPGVSNGSDDRAQNVGGPMFSITEIKVRQKRRAFLRRDRFNVRWPTSHRERVAPLSRW